MARTFGRGIRQIRDASQEIQDDIKKAAFDDQLQIIHQKTIRSDWL